MKKLLRGLGILAGVVALLVVVLLALGMREGAGTVRASLEIGRPVAQVWPWLHDPEKLKAWVGWLLEVKQESPTRQIWVMEDRNNKNARMEMTCDIITDEKPRRMVVQVSVPGGFEGETVFTLTPLGPERTKLEQTGKFSFDHWFAKLMTPVIVYSAGNKVADDLAGLKAELEKTP
jgi:uncharacterized protein YndB with AHSA1/START domain